MNCPKCGGTIPAKSNFCTHCGANLAAAAAEENQALRPCPKCGYQPEHPSKFCIRCGASMTGVEEEPTRVVDIPKQESPKQEVPKQEAPRQTAQPQQQAQPRQTAPQQQTQPRQAAPQQQQRPQQQYVPPQGYGYQQYSPNQAGYNYYAVENNPYMDSLIGKLKVSWILCLIAAILACIGAAVTLGVAIYLTIWLGATYGYVGNFAYYSGEYMAVMASMITLWIVGAAMLAGAIVNFVYVGRTKRYINQIRVNPAGITSHFASSGRAIGLLIVNIILVGSIGIVGAIFAIVAGSYVRSNRDQFAALEHNGRRY